ncbi:MAG: helix-turn-helix transcriptional regulator [Nitrospirales bacterium]|nr:helix-turn-helix transcriptional regulator [Nitrospirales bacterium]
MERSNRKIEHLIREIRKAKGISQMELAERIGISYQQVQKYERGVSALSVRRLQQIADALEVPLSLFFPAEGERVAESIPSYGNLTGEEQLLLTSFRSISDRKVRKAVLSFLHTVSGGKGAR